MTESKDQRTGWLKDLKVGDKVFVRNYRGALGSVKSLAVVDKITPTGRINIGCNNLNRQESTIKATSSHD
jgi:hypothetical protein